MLDTGLSKKWNKRLGWGLILCLAMAWVMPAATTLGQSTPEQAAENAAPTHSPSALPTVAGDSAGANPASAGQVDSVGEAISDVDGDSAEASVRTPLNPRDDYKLWVVAPAVIAILLAIIARQVIPALVVGVLVGAYMMLPCLPAADAYTQMNSVVGGFRMTAEKYILGAIRDPSDGFAHLKIIVFTMVIGFVVGVIGRNGGTAGMVKLVAGETKSPRRGALTAWFAGLIVFFDDYANTMIVGPTMRSVFDRLKLSRAKLAYIVDSTAAPVSSIALIGTWVGAEVGFIQEGLTSVAQNGAPLLNAAGAELEGMQAFLYSLPYRFYPLLALFLVFLVAVTGRDFGPMKRSERKAQSGAGPDATGQPDSMAVGTVATPRWWLGVLPIAVLVFGTLGVLVATGLANEKTIAKMSEVGSEGQSVWAQEALWKQASTIISNADSYLSIFYGAVLAAVSALFLTMLARACSARDAVDAGLEGLARMAPATVILVLAWSLSAVLKDLNLGNIVADHMKERGFEAQWLPAGVFLTAALISFSTGTSWGTMGILCPMTVTIGASLMVGMDPAEALPLLYAAIGSVLAGAVFGDHCSPISDTTVLSSIAAGCRHEEHVWTQIPYALVAGVAAMGLGDVLCSVYKQPWYLGLGAGALFLVLWIFIVGRRVVADADGTAAAPGPAVA